MIGVAVMPDGSILGVGTDNTLYTRANLTAAWSQVANSGSVKSVTVQADGTIVGLGMDNTLYTRASLTANWAAVPYGGVMNYLVALQEVTVIGVGTDNLLYTRAGLTGAWVQVANSGSVKAVAVLANGTIVGVNMQGKLVTRTTLTGGWVASTNQSGTMVGVAGMPDGTILGVGSDNTLYTRANPDAAWSQVANSGSVIAVAVLSNGTIVGVGTDNCLYTRANLTAPWSGPLDNSCATTAVTDTPDGTLVGVDVQGYLKTYAGSAGWYQVDSNGTVIGVAAMGGTMPQRIAFNMQNQQTNWWCWAATTASVSAFYAPNTGFQAPNTPWTQCLLANSKFNRNDCCPANTAPAGCINGSYPDGPLTTVGNLNQTIAAALSVTSIAAEIGANKPIVVDTHWTTGGGHIVAIRGRYALQGVECLSVADPWYGNSEVTYQSFLRTYQGNGVWTNTYTTKPKP